MLTGLSVEDLLASDLAFEMALDEFKYQWTQEHELLATIADQLSALTRVMLQAYGAKNVAPFTPYPRPERKKAVAAVPATNVISFGEFKDWIGRE
jgi:hypothetical protein